MGMRHTHMTVAALLVAGVLVAPAAADPLKGEVIDLSCYLSHPHTSLGASHRKCAETCAKKGLPMGILTDDGKAYVLLEDHANPKAYAEAIGNAAKTITVQGTLVTEGGLPGVVVESVD
jgi:hypothetical protein